VQIDCWGETYVQADAVFDALRKRLNGFRGAVGSDSPPSGFIQGAFLESERDAWEDVPELVRRMADFFVWHEEVT